MSDQEIEEEIQCTAEHEETLADLRHSVDPIICGCGVSFLEDDEGVSTLLKKCRVCLIILQTDLGDHSSEIENPRNLQFNDASFDDVSEHDQPAVEYTEHFDEEPSADLLNNETDASPTVDFVLGAMTMAIADSERTFSIVLNGEKEDFKFVVDPVNGSASRKLFIRQSWKHPALYWYRVFGAIATGKKMLISPCVIELKNGGPTLVLSAILETMCNRPRYDGLVYSTYNQDAFILKDVMAKFQSVDLTMPFNKELVDR